MNITFVFKIFLLSAVLSYLIKYGGRYLAIAPTFTNTLVAVCLPSLILLIALSWRSQMKK